MTSVIGLDFGTTNSAIAVATSEGSVQLATFPANGHSTTTFRSVLYFDPEDLTPEGRPRAVAGPQAIARYLEAGTRARLIQSLKSYLASRLFTHTTLFGSSYTLEDLIAMLVHTLREGATAQFGHLGSHVVVGRPVHFSQAKDDTEDAFALHRLREALEKGGFTDVEFEFEPVAAAYAYERQLDHEELVLIGDFGGGTSDFSLVRLGRVARQTRQQHDTILGTDGVPLAGDTFDSRIVQHIVAPRLGYGSQYRTLFNKALPIPI